MLFVGGVAAQATPKDVKQELSKWIDDRKTQVLDVAQGANGAIRVTTTEETVIAHLAADKDSKIVVRRLPDRAVLADAVAGVVRVPVAAIHRAPKFSSEIVSEAVMGTPVYLLEKDGWWRIQTPEGYHGWVHRLQVKAMTQKSFQTHFQKPQAMVTALEAEVRSESGEKPVAMLTAGSLVSVVKSGESRTLIALPDGRTGWIERKALQKLEEVYQAQTPEIMRAQIAHNALQLTGRSYRWAGTSSVGMDCSGLVKVAWLMAGLVGPRDTDEMAALPGRLPEETKTFEAGDLLFLGNGKSVGHVLISLGGTRFVHALGDVHVGDFDPASSEYDKWAKDTYMFAVRPEMNGKCIRPMTDLPLFAGKVVKPELCRLKIR
ncbi:MAG: SH3 domain-containing C40 family peptidase [Sutterellaceae bacterium]|nr:SH3 domain-containing C40 family peptidase [Sutterellaceae bacterium]